MQLPTVLVTGASQGLGAAIASIAAARGAHVVLTARSQAALQEQCERIRQGGGTAIAVTADITKSEDCREITPVAAASRDGFDRFDPEETLHEKRDHVPPLRTSGDPEQPKTTP